MTQRVSIKRPAIAALSAFALLVIAFGPVSAQPTGDAAHTPSFAKLSDSAIAQFKANPQALLTIYASAGLPLSTEVRSLVLTDPGLVDALITLAKGANDSQKAAIGAGLAEAARDHRRHRPQACRANSNRRRAVWIGAADHRLYRRVERHSDRGDGRRGRWRRRRRRGPTGGVGNFTGSNTGATPSGSLGALNASSPFGSVGGTIGGGSTVARTQR